MTRRRRSSVKHSNFLNVDLEIDSASKLDALGTAMGKRVVVLHCVPKPTRRHFLVVESSRQNQGADATIHSLCAVIESLPAAARRIWNAARKTFDVGYELRPGERSSGFTLRPDTLERIAKLGATLAVTYYRGEANDA